MTLELILPSDAHLSAVAPLETSGNQAPLVAQGKRSHDGYSSLQVHRNIMVASFSYRIFTQISALSDRTFEAKLT